VKPIFAMPIEQPKDYRPIVVDVGAMRFDLKSGVLHYFELTTRKGFTEDWEDYCVFLMRDVSDMVTSFTKCTLEEIEEDMDSAREMLDFIFFQISTQFQYGEA
jgi:hypothetical protein